MKKYFALLGALVLTCGSASYLHAEQAPQAMATQLTNVSGTVTDENGDPVIGASVSEIGTTRATATDINGRFNLRASGKGKIQISYVGYKTVTLEPGSNMNIQLTEDNALLDEVVVVGYGQQKKVNLTGAVSVVDIDKTLTSRPEQDVSKALQGAVPGLTVISNNGDIGESPTLTIRGVGTLSNGATSNPLIVVDGVVVDDLTMINGNDIASISVLKDAASSAIYGTRAAFGVILITTKTGKKDDRINIRYNNNFSWDQATMLPDFPDVPTQLKSAILAKARAGSGSVELFGMYFDQLLPYAEKWKEQNSGRKGYGEMRPYVDENDVGDYRFIGGQPMYYADFDVTDIWYRQAAPGQSHNVSVDGSSGRTTFRMAFGYSGKEDLMPWNTTKRTRYNASANIQTDFTDWLTVGARISYNRRYTARAETWNNMYQYIWRWGSFFIPSGTIDGLDFRVIAMQKEADRRRITHDEIKATAFFKAHITKDLTLNGDFTWQVNDANMRWSDFPVYSWNWNGVNPTYVVGNGSVGTSRGNAKAQTWIGNIYAEYMKSINDAHNIKIMIGATGEKRKFDEFDAYRMLLYSTEYPELNLTYGPNTTWAIGSSTSGYISRFVPWMRGDYATAGYFARFNYDYKGIYLFEANGRYDGSSSFPKDDRWAFFPSFSLGYRFSEEAYFEKARDVVSNGKLRFSYGTIGNEAIGNNMFISTIGAGQLNYLDNSGAKYNYFGMPSWVSSSLTWEKIKTINVGLDLGFLNDMITLSAEWFQRTTNDMLAPGVALPASVGAASPYQNNGSLRSRGWELTINWRKQFNRDLGLYANFSIGDSKVKVTKWDNPTKQIGHPLDATNAYEGETWGDIWGFETDRYFTEADFTGKNADGSWIYAPGIADQTGLESDNFVFGPGDIKFKDLNGDGKIDGGASTADDHGDLKVIGNCLPRYEYSFHIGGTYKGFDLDLFFQGVGKRNMWTQSAFVFPMMRNADLAIYANQTKYNVYDPANGIVNISESNDFPCLWPGNEVGGTVPGISSEGGCHNYYPQTKYLVDMSYLRLKNITLGYTIPQNLTKKIYIQNLRLYASVNNLCLLYRGSKDLPIDPEMNAGQGSLGLGTWGRTYPVTRSWSVGLQVTF